MTYYIRPYRPQMRRRMITENANILRVDVREEDNEFIVTTAVPGLSADDLTIQVLDNILRIEGEYPISDGEHLLREMPEGKFLRTLQMPSDIDADKVEARIENGILNLSLPKVEAARPKQIKIVAK